MTFEHTQLTDEGKAILCRLWRRYRLLQCHADARARRADVPMETAAIWGVRAMDYDDVTNGRTHPVNVEPAAWAEVCREMIAREGGRAS